MSKRILILRSFQKRWFEKILKHIIQKEYLHIVCENFCPCRWKWVWRIFRSRFCIQIQTVSLTTFQRSETNYSTLTSNIPCKCYRELIKVYFEIIALILFNLHILLDESRYLIVNSECVPWLHWIWTREQLWLKAHLFMWHKAHLFCGINAHLGRKDHWSRVVPWLQRVWTRERWRGGFNYLLAMYWLAHSFNLSLSSVIQSDEIFEINYEKFDSEARKRNSWKRWLSSLGGLVKARTKPQIELKMFFLFDT